MNEITQADFVKMLSAVEPEAAAADFDNELHPDLREIAYRVKVLERRMDAWEREHGNSSRANDG